MQTLNQLFTAAVILMQVPFQISLNSFENTTTIDMFQNRVNAEPGVRIDRISH